MPHPNIRKTARGRYKPLGFKRSARNLSKFSSKGMIEVQFNWIFVLIVGFIIFMFIISLVMSQKKNTDNTLKVEILNQLTASIKGKQQLSSTYSELTIPGNIQVIFSCDKEVNKFEFLVEGAPSREQLPLDVIFVPENMQSSIFIIWTQDFGLPFIVTRFMYMTTPRSAFFVYSTTPATSAISKQLYNDLPTNMTKFYITSQAMLDDRKKGFKKFRVVCFNSDCPAANGNDYLNIIPGVSSDVYAYGNLTFHKSPSTNQGSRYITKAGMLGAVFSDDRDFYECQMDRAIDQFNVKRGLQYTRLKLIQKDLNESNFECISLLASPESSLLSMQTLNLSTVNLLYSYSKSIELSNQDASFKGCPAVR